MATLRTRPDGPERKTPVCGGPQHSQAAITGKSRCAGRSNCRRSLASAVWSASITVRESGVMRRDFATWGSEYARVLNRAFEGDVAQLTAATRLLNGPMVDLEAASLDAHSGRIRHFVGEVVVAVEAVGPRGILALQAAAEFGPVRIGKSWAPD